MYGATKLASELICEEYRAMYGLRTVINRCGVIAGPWQMGKVDQGVVVLWAARHAYGGELSYVGFGGDGLQVRDVLHVADLCDLIRVQLADLPRYDGAVFNVGGGRERSVSLLELTRMCAERSGRELRVRSRRRNPARRRPLLRHRQYGDHRRQRLDADAQSGRRCSTMCLRGCASTGRRSNRCWDVSSTAAAPDAPRLIMSVALITGAAGLIGAEAVAFFAARGYDVVGIDNDMRRYFFGDEGSTAWRQDDLQQRVKGYRHVDDDIRDADAMARTFSRYGARSTSSSTRRRSRRTTGPRASR